MNEHLKTFKLFSYLHIPRFRNTKNRCKALDLQASSTRAGGTSLCRTGSRGSGGRKLQLAGSPSCELMFPGRRPDFLPTDPVSAVLRSAQLTPVRATKIEIVNENEDRSMNESITHLGSNPLEEGHVHKYFQSNKNISGPLWLKKHRIR